MFENSRTYLKINENEKRKINKLTFLTETPRTRYSSAFRAAYK